MAEIMIWGSRGGVREGELTINTGAESTLDLALGVAFVIVVLYAGMEAVLLVFPPRSPWPLSGALGLTAALYGLRWGLRRRGDDFFIHFRRQPVGSSPAVTYELKYRFKTVHQGAFGPELLRIASYWQQLYPAGGGHVFQLIFRPDPPATMVHERYSEGIPIFESRAPKECLEQAIELLKVLKYDPAEIEARIQEVEVLLPEKAQPAPPPGDAGGGG